MRTGELTIPIILASANRERLSALEDRLRQEGNLQTSRLHRPGTNTMDGDWRDDGGWDTVLQTSSNDGSIDITMDMGEIERGDFFHVCRVMIDFRRRISVPIGDIMKHTSTRGMHIMAYLSLSHAFNDGLTTWNMICRCSFWRINSARVPCWVEWNRLTEDDISFCSLLYQNIVRV